MSQDPTLHIFMTGDMGPGLPPPFGGIMKRALLHAKDWRGRGAQVTLHVYAKKSNRDDLGAGAEYIYDFQSVPGMYSKMMFIVRYFLHTPILFMRLFSEQMHVASFGNIARVLYTSARGVLIDEYFTKHRPDAVVAETAGFQSYVASLVAHRHAVPLVLIHSAEIMCHPESDKLWRNELDLADAIISTSRHCAKGPETFVSRGGKMHLIYSGVNFELFSQPLTEGRDFVRGNLGISSEKYVMLSIGSLHPRKGHDQLLLAILAMPEEMRRNILVVLCGTGSVADMWKKIDALNFPRASVKILEKLPEERLAQLYGSADCFCFPSVSDRECMGLALKEAFSAGLPVAAYRSGGIPEAVEEGVNGFLAEPGDIQGLARALSAVMSLSDEGRMRMKEANQEKARNLFDIRRTAGQVYETVKAEIARAHHVGGLKRRGNI